jgi:hypothetical protein
MGDGMGSGMGWYVAWKKGTSVGVKGRTTLHLHFLLLNLQYLAQLQSILRRQTIDHLGIEGEIDVVCHAVSAKCGSW